MNGTRRTERKKLAKLGRQLKLEWETQPGAAAWACTACYGPSSSAMRGVFPGWMRQGGRQKFAGEVSLAATPATAEWFSASNRGAAWALVMVPSPLFRD